MGIRNRVAVGVLIVSIGAISCERGVDPGEDSAAESAITFQNALGSTISGTLYAAPGADPPGIILVHDAGGSRVAWGGFPERLRAQGYTCLAVDLAGHGLSTADGEIDFRTFSDADWRDRIEDIAAAQAVLIAEGCDPENVGGIGAGMGGLLCLAAAGDGDLASVVLLSPELERHGFELMRLAARMERTPVLAIASEGDSAAVMAGQRLQSEAPGFCEYRVYPGSLHGTNLIAGSESASQQIFQWLEQTLPAERAD